jgi:hypothetical protein
MDEQQRLNSWRYDQLVWNTRWLAAEPEMTLAAEPRVGPDEIALCLDDILAIEPLEEIVAPALAEMVTEIDRAWTEMTDSGRDDLWTAAAVRSSPEWAAQRERARAVLRALNEPRDDAGLPGHV